MEVVKIDNIKIPEPTQYQLDYIKRLRENIPPVKISDRDICHDKNTLEIQKRIDGIVSEKIRSNESVPINKGELYPKKFDVF